VTALPIAFPPGAFRRENEEEDSLFYAFPRRVVHLDDAARAALTRLYGALVPPRGCVLDLMASWRSHMPAPFTGTVLGIGLNREEMADNPQLSQALVHDVNREPRLPFNDGAFDAALCAVSVQYLTQPVEVFREVWRTLRPGAPFVVSFSNRCFPEKAVALWRAASDHQHLALIVAYFEAAGGVGRSWSDLTEFAHEPPAGDPLWVVWALRAA
jgi:SAM-dependent methyltransferase